MPYGITPDWSRLGRAFRPSCHGRAAEIGCALPGNEKGKMRMDAELKVMERGTVPRLCRGAGAGYIGMLA